MLWFRVLDIAVKASAFASTAFGFGGWLAITKGEGGTDVMMGDLVLLEDDFIARAVGTFEPGRLGHGRPDASKVFRDRIALEPLREFAWRGDHRFGVGFFRVAHTDLPNRCRPGMQLIPRHMTRWRPNRRHEDAGASADETEFNRARSHYLNVD